MTLDRTRELLKKAEQAYDLMDEISSEEDIDVHGSGWSYISSSLAAIDADIDRLKEILARKEQELLTCI